MTTIIAAMPNDIPIIDDLDIIDVNLLLFFDLRNL
tara:strand:- start:606 stop:710 length:105 start_codon:yes stop_codon:yes gene_type:complete